MRDPLHWMPIKYKLPLAFVVLGLLAFGIGGFLVSQFARDALDREIQERLDSSSLSCAQTLDRGLELLRSRCEDFASDGLIRSALEDPSPARREALRTHLIENKIPLVDAFVHGFAIDTDDELVASTMPAFWPRLESLSRLKPDQSGIGRLIPPEGQDSRPGFGIIVPIRSLDGQRQVGRLVLMVDVGRFLVSTVNRGRTGRGLDDPDLSLRIEDGHHALSVPRWISRSRMASIASPLLEEGFGLDLVSLDSRPESSPKTSGFSHTRRNLDEAPWIAVMSIDTEQALAPLRGLENRYITAGILTAAALLIGLSLVVKFLILPLAHMRDMALKVAGGNYACRADESSADEIGDLARGFNGMVEAVAERTRRVESEHGRLNAVVTSMRDGLLLLDNDGRVILSNQAAKPLVDVLRERESETKTKHCPANQTTEACFGCLRHGRPDAANCILEIGDRVFEVSESPLPAHPGEAGGRVLVARDVTERIVFDELQAQQERLTVLGEVTAVVAHEINNPLAAISMFNQMMADGLDEDSPFQENVDVIARNTASCKRAVRDLLDHVSGAASEIALVDIDEILRDVARFLTPLARRSDVVIDFCPAQRSTQILGDEIRLRQVFVNLVVNGIQSIGNRGGRVSIRVTAFEGSSALRIEVEDDGAGVPEELRTRIFEPFFTTKGGQRGTGLGLPTSRRTVEAHGGTLSMQPNEPRGATFVVILPLRTGVSEGSALTELRT